MVAAEAKDEKTFSEVEASEEEEVSPEAEAKQNVCETETTGAIFTYGRLQAKSENPVTGIDFKRREVNRLCPTSFFFFLVLIWS